MKNIIEFISEGKQKTNISKKVQQSLIENNRDKLLKLLTAEPANRKDLSKKFVWISPQDAKNAVDEFEGQGWTTKTPLKDDDRQNMYDAIVSNGGWWFDYRPKGFYNKAYHKCIISIVSKQGKNVAVIMRGYTGCWTMSGEDYVSGSYQIYEIDLD